MNNNLEWKLINNEFGENKYFYKIFLKQQSVEMLNSFDIFKNRDQYILELNEFFFGKWWKFDDLNSVYYKKDPDKIQKNFRDLSKSKKNISLLELKELCNTTFLSNGSIEKTSLPIINNNVETFFVVSWIQNMYDKNISSFNKDILVHQPSIRLNGDNKWSFFISSHDGIATSFVNSTLYNTNIKIKELVVIIDSFFDFLNSIGIYIGDVSLRVEMKPEKRNDQELMKMTIHIFYWNLHLWDAWIWEFKEKAVHSNNFLDLWFWLERINLAKNKINNYFHQYLEDKIHLDRYSDVEIDTIKTLCLIQTQNIKDLEKKSWAFFRYKKLIKLLLKDKNYYPLIHIFFEYRSHFTIFNNTEDEVLRNLLNDLEIYK